MASDIINVPYFVLKTETIKKDLKLFYLELSIGYSVLAGASTYILKSELIDDEDILDFENNLQYYSTIVSCDGEVRGLCSPIEANGKPIVSIAPGEGLKLNKMSVNWCDRTTWWYNSKYIVDEVAECKDPLTHTLYDVSYNNIIDTYHGKITGENSLLDNDGYSYRVIVKVNDIEKTERDPHIGSGGDYTINYSTGRITFSPSLEHSDVVKVTYHYEDGSLWIIKPNVNKIIRIKRAECQFSDDIILTDSLVYDLYGSADYFAPGQFPPGTLIQLVGADYYKTIYDYMNDANGIYPEIPALGGTNWRGCQKKIYSFPWDFQTTTDLYSSRGMELHVYLEHDVSFSGTYATGTFYCLNDPE